MKNTTLNVRVNQPYKIHIGYNLKFAQYIKPFIKDNILLIADHNIPKHYIDNIKIGLCKYNISTIILEKNGEDVKTLEYFTTICTQMMDIGVTRKTLIVAIGGGTVGDFAGFIASTFMRGINFIQVPTTLLAMVDSSVGGKVAVNLDIYKNCIGAFWQPQSVIIDIAFLDSLPKKEILSGYAEVMKYGLVKDENFWKFLLNNESLLAELLNIVDFANLSKECMEYISYIIYKSCSIKADVVMEDEKETHGIRELLNFGHTFAHAFESEYLGVMPHGFAVAIGMVCACKISKIHTQQMLQHYNAIGMHGTIKEFCHAHNLELPNKEQLLQHMKKDKKNDSTGIKLILLEKIGKGVVKSFDGKSVEGAIYSSL